MLLNGFRGDGTIAALINVITSLSSSPIRLPLLSVSTVRPSVVLPLSPTTYTVGKAFCPPFSKNIAKLTNAWVDELGTTPHNTLHTAVVTGAKR